jgi:hypothetical protein
MLSPLSQICDCQCHNHFRGTQKAASQMGKYMKGFTFAERANQWDSYGCAFTDDALAAAIACPKCLNDHCAALLSPRREYRPRIVKRFDPAGDSQQVEQADEGEGAE